LTPFGFNMDDMYDDGNAGRYVQPFLGYD
jgi:hypothetical protein